MTSESHAQYDRYDEWTSYALDQYPKEYAFRVEFPKEVSEEHRVKIELAVQRAMKEAFK